MGSELCVLIVEDDLRLARSLERLFSPAWRVTIATTVEEARRIVDDEPRILAAVIDVSLGDGDGFSLLETLRESGWTIPALMITGSDEHDYPERALRLQASYVRKPFEYSTLEAFLKRAERIATSAEPAADRLEGEVAEISRRHGLSPRQAEVLRGAVFDQSEKEIAERIGIRISTLRTHVRGILAKTGVASLADIARRVRAASRA